MRRYVENEKKRHVVSLNIARELLRGWQHVCSHSTIDQFAAGGGTKMQH